jgi:hypothetical protein
LSFSAPPIPIFPFQIVPKYVRYEKAESMDRTHGGLENPRAATSLGRLLENRLAWILEVDLTSQ